MIRFEENLRIWLKDYPKHIILAKCVSFRAFDHNDPKVLQEYQLWLLPLILKYGLLYGKDQQFPQEREQKLSDEILKNKILDNLSGWNEKFDKEPFSQTEEIKRQIGILKCRQMAYRILPCQESPQNLLDKLKRYFQVFLKNWTSIEKALKQFKEHYGFTIEEYFRVCYAINEVLLNSNKKYKNSTYEIYDLLYFDAEKLCSNINTEHSAQTEQLFEKVLDAISTPLEGSEEKVKANHSNLTELQRFYDYSFFEENYPLIEFNNKYIIPFPYILIQSSWKIMYRFLENVFGKSRLKDKGQLHFTQALENHLISVAEQLPKTIDSCHVYTENNLNKLGVPETSKKVDLVIEFKDSIFLFECKTVEPDKYLKFSLDRKEFIQGFYGKSLYKALDQLISCSNIIQTAKRNKQSFMFVVTLEELYLPNFQTLKEIILDVSLLQFLYSKVCKNEKDKSELASIVDSIKKTNLENVFFISIHEFNMFMNGLKLA